MAADEVGVSEVGQLAVDRHPHADVGEVPRPAGGRGEAPQYHRVEEVGHVVEEGTGAPTVATGKAAGDRHAGEDGVVARHTQVELIKNNDIKMALYAV